MTVIGIYKVMGGGDCMGYVEFRVRCSDGFFGRGGRWGVRRS